MLGESPSPSRQPVEFWNEFRAVYSTPASLLATAEERERGYVVKYTKGFRSPVEAKQAALKNSEETHATYLNLEQSFVTRSKWESVGP